MIAATLLQKKSHVGRGAGSTRTSPVCVVIIVLDLINPRGSEGPNWPQRRYTYMPRTTPGNPTNDEKNTPSILPSLRLVLTHPSSSENDSFWPAKAALMSKAPHSSAKAGAGPLSCMAYTFRRLVCFGSLGVSAKEEERMMNGKESGALSRVKRREKKSEEAGRSEHGCCVFSTSTREQQNTRQSGAFCSNADSRCMRATYRQSGGCNGWVV